jgi:hypothetical protein
MPNTRVFTGSDGSMTLSVPSSPEGEAAKKIIDSYELITVGRVQDVVVEVNSVVLPFHEIGQRYPTELRSGNVTVSGTIGRAFVNGAMLKLCLGEAADSRPARSWTSPAFNITLAVENSAVPGVRSTLTLHEVKIEHFNMTVPEQEFVGENLRYQALFLSVQDEG